MNSWQFQAMQALSRGEKVNGKQLLGLADLGYIFLSQSTESWMPTLQGLEEFKTMQKELELGKVQ